MLSQENETKENEGEEEPRKINVIRGVHLIEFLNDAGEPQFAALPEGGFNNEYELVGWIQLRWRHADAIIARLPQRPSREG